MDESTENYQQIPPQQHNSQEGTSKPPKLFLFAILIVIIIVASAFGAYLYMNNGGGGSIEGRWEMTSANIINEDGSIDQAASDYYGVSADGDKWMEFKSDGTFISDGVDEGDGSTWEVSDEELTLTSESESMTYAYSVSGNTLTLQTEVYWGNTVEIVLKRV